MSDQVLIINEFDTCMKEAVSNLKCGKYEEAYKFIIKAITEDPNAPEPHNLLGILYEFKGNNDLARKHYRIAYVLNPVYKPASVNLERVSTLFLHKTIQVDYGEDIMNEAKAVSKKM